MSKSYSDQVLFTGCRGPDTFERSVAAAQMLGYVSSMQHPYLTEVVPFILPAMLAALQDPMPYVKRAGGLVLAHLLECATSSSLQWQRHIMSATMMKCVCGCDPEIWDVMLPNAIKLAAVLESGSGGRDCDATSTMADVIIEEVERGAYVVAQRRVFLRHASDLARLLGLRIVAHFSVLMPLLLEWMRVEEGRYVLLICEVCSALLSKERKKQATSCNGCNLGKQLASGIHTVEAFPEFVLAMFFSCNLRKMNTTLE